MPTPPLPTLFLDPPAAYRGLPFWSWNGRLNRAELLRQVEVLKAMGMGGFFMHSRTGLATEYLGREWLDLINACADRAEGLGMEAWLYDEDRWPSGTAGGMVTENPAFRMRFLRMEEAASGRSAWPEDALAVFSGIRDGHTVREVRRLTGREETPAEPDRTVLWFRIVEMEQRSFYNGQTYVDTMNPEATERFLERTHARYAEACGDRLGRSIRGIFTDEPHRGALMDPFGGDGERSERQVPWTDALPRRYQEAFGVDLLDHLPELFLLRDGEPVSPIRWRFVEILMRLFLEGFMRPYARWCRDHRVLVTGHVLHEDSLAAQTAMCGSVMRCYEHMDVPGIDLLTEGNRAYWVAKQLQSAARQLGRRRLLSELYGCTGWQMPFRGHRDVGAWQTLFGVNVRCHHLSWYTMEGEAKRDFPASIFHQSAWWRAYRHVETAFARMGLLMDQGDRVRDLLVLNPVESVWARVHTGWSGFLSARDAGIQRLEERYAELFGWLQGAQIDFDYGDEGMLAERAIVEDDGTLRVGKASYRGVVVGGLDTIRSSTLALLERFAARGGAVVVVGPPPAYLDAAPSDAPSRLAAGAVATPWERTMAIAACERAVGRTVEVLDAASGGSVTSVYVQLRRDSEGRTYLMALNTDRENGTPSARLRVVARGPVARWDCLRGEIEGVEAQIDGAWIETPLQMAAGETMIIVYGGAVGAKPTEPPNPRAGQGAETGPGRIAIEGPFRYRLSEPNTCVLDMVQWRYPGGDWSTRMDVLRADRQVRGSLSLEARGGEMLQPWFVGKSGHAILSEVETLYQFDVRAAPTGRIALVIEPASVHSVAVNGTVLPLDDVDGTWVDICFVPVRIPPGLLREGPNDVTVTTRYHAGIGLEAIYVIGEFGVEVVGSRCAIGPLPQTLAVGDLTAQGLPFYGGAISLEIPLPEGRAASSIRTPSLSAACGFVLPRGAPLPRTADLAQDPAFVDGTAPDRMLAWEPYETGLPPAAQADGGFDLHLYLTRRNTFGPLHQRPMSAAAYGPGNWMTEGDAYSEGYVLWPMGLLAPPDVMVSR